MELRDGVLGEDLRVLAAVAFPDHTDGIARSECSATTVLSDCCCVSSRNVTVATPDSITRTILSYVTVHGDLDVILRNRVTTIVSDINCGATALVEAEACGR